ncbi:MAG TPA: hypothetical protein VK845_15240 [Gemmatimonadales bacterium]|nr:hypothetical protein [Gemmatimonadales bacterium]
MRWLRDGATLCPKMTLAPAAGLVAVLGSVVYMVALAPVSGVYGGRDPDEVIAHIRARWRGYVISQVLFAAGALITALGMALLAVHLADANGPLLPAAGAIAMLLGGAMWAVLSYDRTLNFERFFREYGRFPISAWAWLVLTGIGLVIYGFLLPGSDYPDWIAPVTWLLVALQVGGAIFFPKQVPPQIYYAATLLIGIVAFVAPTSVGNI